jgi:hypothetical protein
MKTGRLSYTKDEAGERRIDVAALERVFGKTVSPSHSSRGNGASPATDAQGVAGHVTHEPESERVIAAQRETIAQAEATIRDLRARLDAADTRLDRLLLTDRRENVRDPAQLRRPWWRRWLR